MPQPIAAANLFSDSSGQSWSGRDFPTWLHLILILLPLWIGGLIYLSFRPRNLMMFHVAESMGLTPWIVQLRSAVNPSRVYLPDWIIYSLPHSLWTISMLFFLHWIWGDNKCQFNKWIVVAAAITGGSELLQGVGLLPGTFSWCDLLGIAAVYFCFFAAVYPNWHEPVLGVLRKPNGSIL